MTVNARTRATNTLGSQYVDPTTQHIKQLYEDRRIAQLELQGLRSEVSMLRDFITYMEIEHPGSAERFQLWHAARKRVLDAIGETSETST